MKQDILDRRIGMVLVALGVVWSVLVVATVPGSTMPGTPGPQAFPLLLGILVAIIGLSLVLGRVFHWITGGDEDGMEPVTGREARIVGCTFAVLVAYALLLERIGFILATPLLVIVVFRGLMRVPSWTKTLVTAVALTAGCWLVFAELFAANLPHGTWLRGLI